MPVHLDPPDPTALLPIAGVRLGTARAGIRKPGRRDLLVIALEPDTAVAGVFTQNRFCAAPVLLCREHLAAAAVRYLLVNTGCANAGTGDPGLQDARECCTQLASLTGVDAQSVLPFSTGVIMERLPMAAVLAGLPVALQDLAAGHWSEAAEAIMTTDTVAKAASVTVEVAGQVVRVTGIAKGSGMIHPNMATMLGFIATDAAIAPELLQGLVQTVADASFNRITVDGDQSTNDSLILMATGRAGHPPIRHREELGYAAVQTALIAVARTLAQAIVRDGEGATKFITIQVNGGRSREECLRVARAVAHSPLVKTAFFASDPNLGRILAAIGYAGIEDLAVEQISLRLGAVLVAQHGARAASYREEDGQRVMAQAEIPITIDLGRGSASDCIWTCDFSYEYVRINADYRS